MAYAGQDGPRASCEAASGSPMGFTPDGLTGCVGQDARSNQAIATRSSQAITPQADGAEGSTSHRGMP